MNRSAPPLTDFSLLFVYLLFVLFFFLFFLFIIFSFIFLILFPFIFCFVLFYSFVSFIFTFFPTCQVRVVRFYVSCLLLLSSPLLVSSPPPPAQPRPSTHSGLCRTSTTTIHAQCSLPDLNHDHHRQCSLPDLPRPVFPSTATITAHQPRPSTPSVSTSIPAQCFNHDHPRPVFPAGPQPRVSTPCHIECQKICQIEC